MKINRHDPAPSLQAGVYPAWGDFPREVADRYSIQFQDWMCDSLVQLQALRDYVSMPYPTGNLGELAQDAADTQAHLSTANEYHAKAKGYAAKAQALGEAKVSFEEGLTGNAAQRRVKGHVSDFWEEEHEWASLSSNLQERLWSDRNEMKTFQGPELQSTQS